MSLKAFHVVFLVASTALAVGFAVWGFSDYRAEGNRVSLALAAGSLAAGLVIVLYGRWFLRKLKRVNE